MVLQHVVLQPAFVSQQPPKAIAICGVIAGT